MRRSWAEVSRVAEVRHAARSWREAEVIDAATLAAIEAAYPDPRPALSPAWKVLIFFLVSVAVHAVFFGIAEITNSGSWAQWIVFGVLLAVATEVLRGSRFAGNGADAATSFWAVLYVVLGLSLHVLSRSNRDFEETFTVMLVGFLLLFGAACFHWGYSAYGVLTATALFGLLARFAGGRLWWILAAAILILVLFGRLDRAALAPPHRRALAGVFAVSSLALYAAVNRFSLDRRFIETLQVGLIESLQEGSRPGGAPATIVRILASVATAVLPVIFLIRGIRARRTLILDLGILFSALSLITLRHYVYLAPLWVLLSACGAVLVLGALWLNRLLRRERGGFTAEPLFSGKRAETLQTAAVLAGFAPTPAPERESGGLSTGGGRFGGGGATGEF